MEFTRARLIVCATVAASGFAGGLLAAWIVAAACGG